MMVSSWNKLRLLLFLMIVHAECACKWCILRIVYKCKFRLFKYHRIYIDHYILIGCNNDITAMIHPMNNSKCGCTKHRSMIKTKISHLMHHTRPFRQIVFNHSYAWNIYAISYMYIRYNVRDFLRLMYTLYFIGYRLLST